MGSGMREVTVVARNGISVKRVERCILVSDFLKCYGTSEW